MSANVRLRNLKTSRGSLTNTTVIESGDVELLFSYETLVGVKVYGGNRPNTFISRNPYQGGMSNTTARQISNWLGQKRSEAIKQGEIVEVSQSELEAMVRMEVHLNGAATNTE
jgi:hypothetical protein